MSRVRCQLWQCATFVWFCINMALRSGVGTITFTGLLVCLSAGLSTYLHLACLHVCRHKAGCLLMTACLAACTLMNTVCLIFLSFVKISSTSQPSKMILISWHQSPEPRAQSMWDLIPLNQTMKALQWVFTESPTTFNQRYSGAGIGRRHHPVTLEYSLSEQQWSRWALSLIHLKAYVTPLQISKLS